MILFVYGALCKVNYSNRRTNPNKNNYGERDNVERAPLTRPLSKCVT
jgi:hypothetical protein